MTHFEHSILQCFVNKAVPSQNISFDSIIKKLKKTFFGFWIIINRADG